MDEEIIEEVLASALANLESSSNSEMMLMNDEDDDDDESIDPDLIEMIQQQSIVPATGSSVVVSSIEEIPATD
ncbi:unnamed protein product, partial [Rotaria magnacalcarata]